MRSLRDGIDGFTGKEDIRSFKPDTFHAYPAFTFTPEGQKGEQQVIDYIKEKMIS